MRKSRLRTSARQSKFQTKTPPHGLCGGVFLPLDGKSYQSRLRGLDFGISYDIIKKIS